MSYIYVLDYSDATICEIDLDNIDEKDRKDKSIEEIIELYGCNTNTSSWMIVDNKIDNIIKLN